ncbi:unnamed protein product [Coffea canephora]|uniref:Strictosidine synthase conserved region domain-containing protein n=1 Tax=Coffea canephora TaxID=49390 RepID=A0A068UVF3_COFCA|nr:unnamed protein product [Coffea canephora]
MAILSIFYSVAFLPHLLPIDPYSKFTQVNLPPGSIGPESVALDRFNQGPYVGVLDGTILKYKGPNIGFVFLAYTSRNRTRELCDVTTDPNLGPICGWPFGFSFNVVTGFLYVVDVFLGLSKVGTEGGNATLIANSAGGVPFQFLNGVDVDQFTGDVYFTDASQTIDIRNITSGNYVPDSTGRLLKYSPITGEVKVLAGGFSLPGGPVISVDRKFVLFAEFSNRRIMKYWLTGNKANTVEVLLYLPGNPIKIKKAPEPGEFWVAVDIIAQQPSSVTPLGYKFNSTGGILLIKEFEGQYNNIRVNVVQEYIGGKLYIGSREAKFVGIYSKW